MLNYFLRPALLGALLVAVLSVQGQDSLVVRPGARNLVGINVGAIEVNIAYERTLAIRPRSRTNLRVGLGDGRFFTAGEGQYINPAWVFLNRIGNRNAHFEINAGGKLMLNNTIDDPSFFEAFVPDLFIGYRHQDPSGGFMFRLGLNYPTLINLGLGYSF